MPGVTVDNIPDVLTATLENLPQRGEIELALKYRNYPICDQWFRGGKKQVTGGEKISRRIQLRSNGSARHVDLYEVTGNEQVDTMEKIEAPWVHVEAKFHIENHEVLFNKSAAQIVDLVKSRRLAAYQDYVDEIEAKLWASPDDSGDTKHPYGVAYWCNFLETGVTDPTGGFNGKTVVYGDGTTSTSVGAIDGNNTLNSRWRNWAATYTDINATFIDTLRNTVDEVDFEVPISLRDLYKGRASRTRIYSSKATRRKYQKLVNAGPDDRNGDLEPAFGNMLTFMRVPWIGVSALDGVSYSPVYVLDHQHFFPYVLEDMWMKEGKPMTDRSQRHVHTVGIDGSYQAFCLNRRHGCAVVHTGL